LNPRRIVAAILLIVVVTLIVYPPLSTGTVSVRFKSKGVGSADHLYITVNLIELHEAGVDNRTGWNLISNATRTIDLIDPDSLASFVVEGTVHTGWYDMIAIQVASASLVQGSNETALELSSEQYYATVPLVLKTFSRLTVTVQFSFNATEAASTSILRLELEAVLTPPLG